MLTLTALWPWLVVAGAGALHGLNPATGWALVAALGAQASNRASVLRALVPVALGHLASVALVTGAVMLRLSLDRRSLQVLVAAALVVLLACHLARCRAGRNATPTGQAGLALWSFLMATGHGAGLMLVPALMPLCLTGDAGALSAFGTATLALLALGLHMAAMLLVTGVMATMGRSAFARVAPTLRRLWRSPVRP